MKHPLVFALGLAVLAAGCSGKSDTSSSQEATQNPSQSGGATTAPEKSAAAGHGETAGTLAVYPGAAKYPTQFTKSMTFCTHKITPVIYHVADTGDKVLAWYTSRMPGSEKATLPGAQTANGTGMTGYVIVSGDGTSSVIIEQMHFGALQKTAEKFGMGSQTTIGLSRYDPPLSSDEVHMIGLVGSADAAAKARAKAAFKQRCGLHPFSFG